MSMFKKAYTFDDVCLVPAYSNVESRLDPDLSTWLTKDIKISIPIVNAPMDTVIGNELAEILLKLGTIPIFNRFKNFEDYIKLQEKFGNKVFVSTGVQNLDFTKKVLDLGFDKLLLDTANGHTRTMMNFIEGVKTFNPKVQVMAGNVCTALACVDLINFGADSIRAGIGGGSACTTRIKTAVGVPQFSATLECAEMAKKYKIPLVADGGIKGSKEICLALAGGASAVMVGKLLAKTFESAAPKNYLIGTNNIEVSREEYYRIADIYNTNDEKEIDKLTDQYDVVWPAEVRPQPIQINYRGQASLKYQLDNYGSLKEGTTAEGESFLCPASGPAEQVIQDLLGGLRSSMTYLGSKTLKEYQTKAEFREVTSSYMVESNTRKD